MSAQQTQPKEQEQEQGLVREMGLLNALSIGLGTMLGAGIFVLSGTAAQQAGPAASVAFVMAGLICLPIAMTVSELVTAMPQDGGSYYLISRTLGAAAAAVLGAANWLGLMFATGFYLIGFAEYLADFVPVPPWASELGAGLLFTFLNYRGAKLTGSIQTYIVAILVIILAGFAGLGIVNVEPELHENFAPYGWGAAFGTVGLIIVSFTGFEKVSTVAEEVKDPGRNLPKAIIGSVVIATVIYAAVVYVLTGVLDEQQIVEFDPPMIEAAEQFMGNIGGIVIGVGALLATASSANAAILASSRINFAMGRDQILPSWFGKIHPHHMTPSRSIVVTGGLAIALALSGQAPLLAEISSALFMISYALLPLGLIVVQRASPDWYQPSFRVPFSPWLPLLGGGAAVVVIGTLDRFSQLTGLGLAAISLLWYYLWARHRTTISGELGDWLQRAHPIRSALGRTEAPDLDRRPTILVPVNGVETGRRLVSLATALATGQPGTTVTALKIVQVPYNLALAAGQQQIQRVTRHQHELEQTIYDVERGDVEIKTQVQGARKVASAIVEIATQHSNLDLVLLGWHGPLTLKRIRASIDKAVLNNVASRVAVLQDKGLERVQRVLVAIADNRHAPLELQLAHDLQRGVGADVTIFHVITAATTDSQDQESTIRRLVDTEWAEDSDRLSVKLGQSDSVAHSIVTEAEQGYDLVIMGASEQWFLQRWLFSGVADRVADDAPCSVLLVRQ
ncbi:MAG: amino acid permease [Leptolyngbya sp. DLM2.Bin27]|nr:MAG: amino acid permease [Leptolyngbya sp. DLM2.Bin27]